MAAPVAESKEADEKKPAARKVTTKGSVKTLANYLLTQLREFDPETYDPDDPQVLRKCDKPRQPIILSPADMTNVANGDYDPRNRGAAAVLNVRDPDGYVICPAYWCTYDRIPLTEEQLGDANISRLGQAPGFFLRPPGGGGVPEGGTFWGVNFCLRRLRRQKKA